MELLFTNIPIYIALEMVLEHLNAAGLSHDLSVLTETNVVHKLKLCPKSTAPQWDPTFTSAGEHVFDNFREGGHQFQSRC
jgi:hypothetical protein